MVSSYCTTSILPTWLTKLLADLNSAFPAGINVAATWSTRLFRNRGYAMGKEHSDKGVDMALGPVAGPIGRVPAGGRNWEGKLTLYSE